MKANMILSKVTLIVGLMIFYMNSAVAQITNFITTGDMENMGWAAVPGNTDLLRSFETNGGVDNTTGLKVVTTSMGGDDYYILRCDEFFHMTESDKVTVSFWAKGLADNMRLQPWVQESDGFEWVNFGDAYLTTQWKQYKFTISLPTQTSDNYKIKFRGYNTGTIYIDDVIIGPVEYEDVAQSGIYEVSVSQNGMTRPLNVFRNSCPSFSLGYEGMEAKDAGPLNLFSGRTINWAKFSFDNPITVHVKVINTQKVPVSGQTVRILPSRHNIAAATNGNVVSFTITDPGQYSVEIGPTGYQNGLILFVDPVETDIPSQLDSDFLVLSEASPSDVSSISTTYSGIYFKPGVHDIGILDIPTHIKNIYFEDGSWVYGALKMDGNPGVRMYGRGVLSSARMNYRQTHCIEAINGSNNITIEGLVVADPKYFAIRLIGTDNDVDYTKVIGGWVYNCDGIAAFKGSSVSKSFIWANDDAIKIYRDSITYSDIVVWQLNNGGIIQMSWGGAVGGSTAKEIKISRVDVLHAEWDKQRFNTGLLSCVGNRYETPGKYALLENWLIEDVVTENPVPIVFNITPDDFTHNHIHGLTLKNWDVQMPMNTNFTNEIKGEDPNDFFSGFVFDNFLFNGKLLTDINYVTTGDMESGGWTGVPKTTDQVMTLGSGLGTGGSTGLRSVVTNMGGGTYYAMKCNEKFHLDYNEEVSVSFWARATAAGKKLVPWIQETDNNEWMNIGEVYLTTGWQWYSTTAIMNKITSDNYQVKFRGYETAWMFIDKVQIGPVNWRTIIQPDIQYLNTPTFLPNGSSARMQFVTAFEDDFISGNYKVHPNPANHILYISDEGKHLNYKVYTITGILQREGNNSQINVSGLYDGMYILIAEDQQPIKFIKD